MTINLGHELTRGFAAWLIREKTKQLVRRPEFSVSDGPDLQQELRLRLLEVYHHFRPEVRHWNVFAKTIIERHVASILEYETAGKRFDEEGVESLNCPVRDAEGNRVQRAETVGHEHRDRMTCGKTPVATEISDLRIEFERASVGLSPELRSIVEDLKTYSVTDLARRRGIARQSLANRVRKIREVFEAYGLRNYHWSSIA